MSNNIINRVKARQASFNLPVNQEVSLNANGSGGPISINRQTSNQDSYEAENKGATSWLSDWGHVGLDALGMLPGIGAAADLANAAWYTKQGDYANAAWSAAAAIPGAGQGATAAKYAAKAAKAAKGYSKIKKGVNFLNPIRQGRNLVRNIGMDVGDIVRNRSLKGFKPSYLDIGFGGVSVAMNANDNLNTDYSSDTSSDTSNNTYLDNLNKNNASNTNTTTDNKYENNQRTSNRVSQGTKSWSKGYSDWKGKGNTGSMEDFKTQANTWWDSDAGQRHAKSKGIKHRIKSV